MSKLWLIIQREYITRVRTRGFLLGTILTPLAVAAFIGFQGLMMSYKSGDNKHIVLLDEGGYLKTGLPDGKGVNFSKAPAGVSLDSLKNSVRAYKKALSMRGEQKVAVLEAIKNKGQTYDGILRLMPLPNFSTKKHTFYYYSDDQLSPEVISTIENRMAKKIRDFKIDSLHFDRKSLGELDTDVSLDPEPIDKVDDNASSLTSGVAMAIAMLMGVAMYTLMLMWGSMVMRSVMEEKTNRIVEVIMSSVRPFDLMLGKIIGSAGVGLTQLLLWGFLSNLVILLMGLFFNIDTSGAMPTPDMAANPEAMAQAEDMLPKLMAEIGRQNWWYIFGMMLMFFLGGYFLYAALFAAIGSASGDDLAEGQQLAFPVMLPIIIAFILVVTVVNREPNSTLSVFASIFPLFSPVVMPARLAFDPPLWQVLLSIFLLILTSIGFVWVSGRIYRVGILLYGKKVTFKEVWRWMFYKG
jgi:ABC-2 type transport system permease protein